MTKSEYNLETDIKKKKGKYYSYQKYRNWRTI